MTNVAGIIVNSLRKGLTLEPNAYQMFFERSEYWEMGKIMTENIDIQEFLDLLDEPKDASFDGYQLLLHWARKIIESFETQKDRGDPLDIKAQEFVHDFIIHKVPNITKNLDQNAFSKYQIAVYIRSSLAKYYLTYLKKQSGVTGKSKPKVILDPERSYDDQYIKPKKPVLFDEGEVDLLHFSQEETASDEMKQQTSSPSHFKPEDDNGLHELMSGRNSSQVYELLDSLSPKAKKYLLYIYIGKDKSLYKDKSPEAMRKEHSFARQDIANFIHSHSIESYEMDRFFHSMLGRAFFIQMRQEMGEDHE